MIRWLFILAAVVYPAAAQAPETGDINFYGLRKLTPEKVLSTIDLEPGNSLTWLDRDGPADSRRNPRS